MKPKQRLIINKQFLCLLLVLIPFCSFSQTKTERIYLLFNKYDSIANEFIPLKDSANTNLITVSRINSFRRKIYSLNNSFNALISPNDTVLNEYIKNARKLVNHLRDFNNPNQTINYLRFISQKEIMDHYKTTYRINNILRKVDSKANQNLEKSDSIINYYLPNQEARLNHIIQHGNAYLENELKNKIDSLANLTNYTPWFVGPSFYVESTYGFNFTNNYSSDSLKYDFTFLGEILYFSNGQERRYGLAGSFGPNLAGGKIIPQVGFQILTDKRSLESDKNAEFHASIGCLFKNREWMAGFNYSPITGGGIKLLIGL